MFALEDALRYAYVTNCTMAALDLALVHNAILTLWIGVAKVHRLIAPWARWWILFRLTPSRRAEHTVPATVQSYFHATAVAAQAATS